MKTPIRFAAIILVLINICNGEVEICLKLKSGYRNTKEISTLLEKSDEEIKDAINATGLISAQASNYDYFHLNLTHKAIKAEGNFTNGTVTLQDQVFTYLNLKSDGFEIFNLTFPSIYIDGNYSLNGSIGANRLFDIYGEGQFHLDMINFSVAAITSLKKNTTHLCMPITIKIYLKDFKSNFEKFMGGDADLEPLLNGVIQSLVPEAIMIIFREDADWADPYLQDWINKLLNGNKFESLSNLLHLLSNNKDHLAALLNVSN